MGETKSLASSLSNRLTDINLEILLIAGGLLIFLGLVSELLVNRKQKTKFFLFTSMSLVVGLPSLFLWGSSLFLNVFSDSGGKVSWRAGLEVWACGIHIKPKPQPTWVDGSTLVFEDIYFNLSKELSLTNVLANNGAKIGGGNLRLAVDQNAINQLGPQERSLIDDKLSLVDGQLEINLRSGQNCQQIPSELQIFVYQADENGQGYQQTKLTPGVKINQPISRLETEARELSQEQDYVYTPAESMPPGDCLIIELDVPKESTNKVCKSLIQACQNCQSPTADRRI